MENAVDVAPVKEGVALIQNKLKNILVQKGLKEMESIGDLLMPICTKPLPIYRPLLMI
jgi:molecular chaperone GrpE (heat shock protein)